MCCAEFVDRGAMFYALLSFMTLHLMAVVRMNYYYSSPLCGTLATSWANIVKF